MATLVSESFETVADGTAITSANSAFKEFVKPTFTSDTAIKSPIGGSTRSAKVVSDGLGQGAQAQAAFSAVPVVQTTFDYRLDSAPTSYVAIAQLSIPGTIQAELRVNASGTLQTRGRTFIQSVVTPAGIVKATSFVRIVWVYDSQLAQHRLQVFDPADLVNPIFNSGPVAAIADVAPTQLSIGSLNGTTPTTSHFDNLTAVDVPTAPVNQPSATPFIYYDNGSAWVEVTNNVTYDNGTNWVPITV